MSLVLQWIFAGAGLAGAVGYLLYRLGVFALLGWAKPRRSGACAACPQCPAAQRIVARLAERD